jgi:hypothetical protein
VRVQSPPAPLQPTAGEVLRTLRRMPRDPQFSALGIGCGSAELVNDVLRSLSQQQHKPFKVKPEL